MTHAVRCKVTQDRNGYDAWRRGDRELRFRESQERLAAYAPIQALDDHVSRKLPGSTVFRRPKGAAAGHVCWLGGLYTWLCGYAHSRPGQTSADIWQSNGPIWRGPAFVRLADEVRATAAVCCVLAHFGVEGFKLPGGARALFTEPGDPGRQEVAPIVYECLFRGDG